MNQKRKLAGAALAGILATLAAGGIAMASMGHDLGPMGRADINRDGQITRAEWVESANARFDKLDANKDGKLIGDELPRRGHRGHHGQRDHGPGPVGPSPAETQQPAASAPPPTPQK